MNINLNQNRFGLPCPDENLLEAAETEFRLNAATREAEKLYNRCVEALPNFIVTLKELKEERTRYANTMIAEGKVPDSDPSTFHLAGPSTPELGFVRACENITKTERKIQGLKHTIRTQAVIMDEKSDAIANTRLQFRIRVSRGPKTIEHFEQDLVVAKAAQQERTAKNDSLKGEIEVFKQDQLPLMEQFQTKISVLRGCYDALEVEYACPGFAAGEDENDARLKAAHRDLMSAIHDKIVTTDRTVEEYIGQAKVVDGMYEHLQIELQYHSITVSALEARLLHLRALSTETGQAH